MKTKLLIQCAWCGKSMGEKEGDGIEGVSHGICGKCELKEQLRSILQRHEGRARAVTGRELANIVGHKDDRQVRLIIRELITEGLPVASATEFPGGYFIVTTRKEAEEYALSIRERLIEDALRRRDFRRAADCYLAPAEQGRLI